MAVLMVDEIWASKTRNYASGTPNTVLELHVYLSQVLHLFKMSFIDGSPSIFLSLLTSE